MTAMRELSSPITSDKQSRTVVSSHNRILWYPEKHLMAVRWAWRRSNRASVLAGPLSCWLRIIDGLHSLSFRAMYLQR